MQSDLGLAVFYQLSILWSRHTAEGAMVRSNTLPLACQYDLSTRRQLKAGCLRQLTSMCPNVEMAREEPHSRRYASKVNEVKTNIFKKKWGRGFRSGESGSNAD